MPLSLTLMYFYFPGLWQPGLVISKEYFSTNQAG